MVVSNNLSYMEYQSRIVQTRGEFALERYRFLTGYYEGKKVVDHVTTDTGKVCKMVRDTKTGKVELQPLEKRVRM